VNEDAKPDQAPDQGPGQGQDQNQDSALEQDRLIELTRAVFDHARAGRADQLAHHLDAGVPVDLTDEAGNTLVMLAAYHGQAAVVRALVSRGAALDRANDRGQTPLAGAVFKGEVEVVLVLAAAGADPGAGQPSAIEAARSFDRPDLLKLLKP
jgi:uncharacterized protein